MKILAFVPQTRVIPPCLLSIHELLKFRNNRIDLWFMRERSTEHRWIDITRKSEIARQQAIDDGYDYLLLLDDDMLIPPDALVKLLECDADIAYGLTVQRMRPEMWSACLSIDELSIDTLDQHPDMIAQTWGYPLPVAGVGSFCTLIRRDVLSATIFHRRGMHNFDRYLAMEAQQRGWLQVCHTGVVCGHFSNEPSPRFLYPDPQQSSGYRAEFVP